MMSTHLIKLFTQPDHVWTEIRKEEEQKPRNYWPHLVFLGLIPPFALFVGTTRVGWSLAENEVVRLSADSALALSAMIYAAILIGTALMGVFIRWMSRTFDARPTLNQCIGFAAYTASPLFVAGLAGLYPSRWLAIAVLLAACAYSTFLLYVGLPTFMRTKSEQGFLFASSVWGVSVLTLTTVMVSAILYWYFYLPPEYLRGPLGQ
jgi:hypothetical protein